MYLDHAFMKLFFFLIAVLLELLGKFYSRPLTVSIIHSGPSMNIDGSHGSQNGSSLVEPGLSFNISVLTKFKCNILLLPR